MESVCLDGHPHIPFNVNHAMMNKFNGPSDGNFAVLSQHLGEILDCYSVISNLSDLEVRCLQYLSTDYEEGKDRNKKRVPGTCQWVLDNDIFQDWRESPSSLLWISADPGCGKSILSKTLIDERLVTSSTKPVSVCCFFFKYDDAKRQTGDQVLAAILHQLFVQRPCLLKHAVLKTTSPR